MLSFKLKTGPEIQSDLALLIKEKRLDSNLSRPTLSEKSGVSSESIKRFELSGEISLKSFVRLCQVLDLSSRLEDFLTEPLPKTLEEVDRRAAIAAARRKRGRK